MVHVILFRLARDQYDGYPSFSVKTFTHMRLNETEFRHASICLHLSQNKLQHFRNRNA